MNINTLQREATSKINTILSNKYKLVNEIANPTSNFMDSYIMREYCNNMFRIVFYFYLDQLEYNIYLKDKVISKCNSEFVHSDEELIQRFCNFLTKDLSKLDEY